MSLSPRDSQKERRGDRKGRSCHVGRQTKLREEKEQERADRALELRRLKIQEPAEYARIMEVGRDGSSSAQISLFMQTQRHALTLGLRKLPGFAGQGR